MMNHRFNEAFEMLMGHEGGYVNHPNDPGGATCYGITERVARENGYTGVMRHLPLETARNIARRLWWDRYLCDDLPSSIALQIFDIAFNGGHPVRWLQLAIGVNADGIMGPLTLQAAHQADPRQVILRLNAYRLTYYTALKNWPHFGRGWANRVAGNLLRGAQ
ncbi:glycoside hydrolase family 108 protein [Pantoea phytobeneficialis]|uniref:Glycosyl hydrolase 108 family protein n=2 Tax=Pantoea phytobeneficialis TaxID=2052056 RepID=A0ABT8XVD4_9GAMM|nr:glycosyl hydrolase 108 family protein [Pantoea phytobeneficialis]MDO6407423.1 glycosyl hydrolase 108 family protein [Pantoea phytobeneficialis]